MAILKQYAQKRNFHKTPEPSPKHKQSKTAKLQFVVQKHAASHLHYDFRLEYNGILLSWAVPKGPSLDPSTKRLAIMVEDHPYSYKDFEGTIPKGSYGGGEVIVWDKGNYEPEPADNSATDNAESMIKKGLKTGKLSFTLHGKKLKGSWTLVKLKGRGKGNEWLLMKHEDKYADPTSDITTLTKSVLSNKTIANAETVQKPTNKVAKIKPMTPLKTAGKAAQFPKDISPMLANLADGPFSSAGWIYEPKLDGIRGISYIRKGQVILLSRRGLNLTTRYPTLTVALGKYKHDLVLDGEVVALDKRGRPSFQLLQQRAGLAEAMDLRKAESKVPIVYYVFDILYLDGRDLTMLPLLQRIEILRQVIKPSKNIRLVESLNCNGIEAFNACAANGLEGVMAKRADSTYEKGRRTSNWLKVKVTKSAEFIICGYTKGTGTRTNTFGALILGYFDQGNRLCYAGNVGTGFDDKKLKQLIKLTRSLKTADNPFPKELKSSGNIQWLIPQLVAEIKYAQWTADKKLRVPVFMHLREDVAAKQAGPLPIISVTRAKKKLAGKSPQRLATTKTNMATSELLEQIDNDGDSLILTVGKTDISFSHLNKVLWPEPKKSPVTKRDYLRYLIEVSPYLLPHLKDRPLTLIRFSHGVNGPRFFQKHWEQTSPEFLETVSSYSETDDTDHDYLLCNNLPTLLWLAQIADLELHTSHCRINSKPDAMRLPKTFTGSVENIDKSLLNYPDFIVFDLDPYIYSGKESKGQEPALSKKGFKKTCEIALLLKATLDQMGIESFVKTSGRTGLHIFVPIIRNLDYDSVRAIAEKLGLYILQKRLTDVTMEWSVIKRTGKVFFDYNMNARGKTLASIYSPRSFQQATISTPVTWNELSSIYPTDFTMQTVLQRLEKLGDLWADILLHKNDLKKLFQEPPGGNVKSSKSAIKKTPRSLKAKSTQPTKPKQPAKKKSK